MEKVKLDEALHRAIMGRVITIQRWMKALLERQNFIKQRAAALKIQVIILSSSSLKLALFLFFLFFNAVYFCCLSFQCHVRRFLAQRKITRLKLERDAAIVIQSAVRMMRARKKFLMVQQSVALVQPFIRGSLTRRRYQQTFKD